MMRTMDLFVSTGLRDAGFDTVSVDDCWVASRDASGVPVADPTSFPSGMKALADYAHARGLKFGLYSSNSPLTCDRRPGSFGFEAIDAAAYASWGVDLCVYRAPLRPRPLRLQLRPNLQTPLPPHAPRP